MQIDLNNPLDFTIQNVAALIASKDDSVHRQLRVTNAGIAYLSDIVGNQNITGLAFRLETWCAGNNYVGIAASQDNDWVSRIYNVLELNWPNPTDTYIDIF
ncbi:hypothetical protein [Aeromonas veronii]|uniref:hypothetical protein n=1 Tax=Aeromonas veronii TaxID=654 RepID=UPI001F2B73ED|nr:hypothetical protein [Aeromonas veronii]MCF5837862.1 hypothetical protein [Aeromonas veronii]MCF5889021.1 hypothetical protein [Aeromonas veronii]